MVRGSTLSVDQISKLVSRFQICKHLESSTEPSKRKEAELAVFDLYQLAGLPPPLVLWCNSPLEAFLARAIVATINLCDSDESPNYSEFERTRIGDSVLHTIRDTHLENIQGVIRKTVSDATWKHMNEVATKHYRAMFEQRSSSVGTMIQAINRHAYIENARSVLNDFGNHEPIPEMTWDAACECAEQVLRRKLTLKNRDFKELSSLRWPYFFNTMRGSMYSGYGQHDSALLALHVFLSVLPATFFLGGRSSMSIEAFFRLAETTGWYLPHQKVCFLSERPRELHLDQRGRLHCEDGPALSFRDGWKLYLWHAIRVDEKIIMRPEEIEESDIDREENAEVRSVMIERYGEERYFLNGNLETIDDDRQYGVLLKRPCGRQPDMFMVRVVNRTNEPDGSARTYLLRVPEHVRTAREAVAWTFGLEEKQYEPIIET